MECKDGIATKFINILRYNPKISKPCLYHLILKKEGENYIFYKDINEYYEGEKEIIEANKNINNRLYKLNDIKYDEIFYMTEINSETFIDKDYLLEHDLCDVPGLTEWQSNPENIVQKNQTTKSKKEVESKVPFEQRDKQKDIVINNQKNDQCLEMIELICFEQKEEDDIFYEIIT